MLTTQIIIIHFFLHVAMVTRALIVQGRTGINISNCNPNRQSTTDLVIERHCESVSWLSQLTPGILSRLSIFIYDKSGGDCTALTQANLNASVAATIVPLPNVGRDGDTQVHHIIQNYNCLAENTAFVQAGYHWTLGGHWKEDIRGWANQADALNELIPTLTQGTEFLPIIARNQLGPILWQDREYDSTSEVYPGENTLFFQAGANDMYNKAREGYSVLFGGSPCEAPRPRFSAGMQYIVGRQALLSRPLSFWHALKDKLMEPEYGYVMERLTSFIYNSSSMLKVQSPETWPKTLSWQKGLDMSYFTTPLQACETSAFWKHQWGCEPRSPQLQDLCKGL